MNGFVTIEQDGIVLAKDIPNKWTNIGLNGILKMLLGGRISGSYPSGSYTQINMYGFYLAVGSSTAGNTGSETGLTGQVNAQSTIMNYINEGTLPMPSLSFVGTFASWPSTIGELGFFMHNLQLPISPGGDVGITKPGISLSARINATDSAQFFPINPNTELPLVVTWVVRFAEVGA